jgi:hypothetical protein
MGLDMYLGRRGTDPMLPSGYSVEYAYWRKFSALHLWFVHNVQGDVDDCGDYLVTKEHLESLLDTLRKVNDDTASELFPTGRGFFFGSTDYDEWYFQDVKETIDLFERTLLEFDFDEEELWYYSSW